MTIDIKLTESLYSEIIRDLARPHPFAAERVGFVMGRTSAVTGEDTLVLLTSYHSIPDEHYVRDHSVGARIGPEAMTFAMQAVYHGRSTREGIFHIHVHEHLGPTRMSGVDRREIPTLIPGFQSVGRESPHGIVILSKDHGSCWVWLPSSKTPVLATTISVVGAPIRVFTQPTAARPHRSRWQEIREYVAAVLHRAWVRVARWP